jgi:hypothetical protein
VASGDNYFVVMFAANDEAEAEAMADAKRPYPKFSKNS